MSERQDVPGCIAPDCEAMQLLAQADHDGELSAAETAEVAAHVARCAACASLQRDLAGLSAQLKAEVAGYTAPNSLREAMVFRLGAARAAPPAPTGWRRRAPPLAGFGMGAALAACLALLLLPIGGAGGLDAELVAGHIRALQPGHLTDVLSSDQHTVKPWFDGRIDYAPPVRDFAASGFPLVGGRLDYVGQRPVAVLVYRSAKHDIDVFVWPGSGAPDLSIREPSRQSRNGYNVVSWNADGMVFHAVSDLNAAELDRFARLWRASPG
jgi:anti-sigma factor RsiW